MKYWIIIACSLANINLFAETDSLSLALVQLEKKIFLSGDKNLQNQWLIEKSELQLTNDKPEASVISLRRIDTTYYSAKEKTKYYLDITLSLLLSGKTDEAFSELTKINFVDDTIEGKIIFLIAFISNEEENFEECKTTLLTDSAMYHCNNSLVSALSTESKTKNPDKARHLSAVLPGAGQIYAGKFWKGLLSFTLTAGFATFGYYNAIHEYYAMSAVSGLYPTLKFYFGGKRLAERLTEDYNDNERAKLKSAYRKQIYESYNCFQKMYPMRTEGVK